MADATPISATPTKSRKASIVLMIRTKKSLNRSFLSNRKSTFLISVNWKAEKFIDAMVALYLICMLKNEPITV
jgi:hypothetical protein